MEGRFTATAWEGYRGRREVTMRKRNWLFGLAAVVLAVSSLLGVACEDEEDEVDLTPPAEATTPAEEGTPPAEATTPAEEGTPPAEATTPAE